MNNTQDSEQPAIPTLERNVAEETVLMWFPSLKGTGKRESWVKCDKLRNCIMNNEPTSNMAWNPHPKVADCREIARRWRKQQVIILAVDPIAGTLECASFGETKELCSEAKKLAAAAYDAVIKTYAEL